jgi:cysteine desulfuration protein SufE
MTLNDAQNRVIAELPDGADGIAMYEHLAALGRQAGPADDRLRTEAHALPGCQSQVWIRAAVSADKLRFEADSDSLIIRGILVLLLRVLNGHSPADVAQAELYFLDRAGLSRSLSPSRANGLATIVRHLQHLAGALAEQDSARDRSPPA